MTASTSPQPWMAARIGVRSATARLARAASMLLAGRRRPNTARTTPRTTGVVEAII